MKRFLVIISVLALFISCDSSHVYEEYISIKDYKWHKDSVLTFTTDTIHPSTPIVFHVALRVTSDYKYRNFWAFTTVESPDGKIYKDTVEHNLLNPEGYWKDYVEGGGGIKSSSFLAYKYGFSKPPKGVYKITIQHAMREQVLGEIVNVGARILKFEQ